MTAVTSSAFAVRGVIEGFYGTPWTEAQRLDMVESIGRWGMTTFIYSPKDDYLLRDGWAEPFDDAALQKLRRLLETCEASGVSLAVAVSPGLSMKYSDASHRSALEAKLLSLVDAGVRSLGLFFDDIPGALQWPEDLSSYSSLAQAHASLVTEMWSSVHGRGATHFMVCPTAYWGNPDDPHLKELCQAIDGDIDVFWTGRSICSATLDVCDAKAFVKATGRPPLYWDNFPVNDVAMKHELHIGPYERREPELGSISRGIVVNAMEYAESSKIPLFTIAEFLADPFSYDAEASWHKALAEVAGDEEDLVALTAFAENSRSSCLSLSDAVPLTDALSELSFSLVSGDYDKGAQSIRAIAEAYTQAAARLLHQPLHNPALLPEMRTWFEAFELGAHIVRRIATLAENRQLETSQVTELEADITRLRAMGRRVFGDSLDMAVEHFVASAQPSPQR